MSAFGDFLGEVWLTVAAAAALSVAIGVVGRMRRIDALRPTIPRLALAVFLVALGTYLGIVGHDPDFESVGALGKMILMSGVMFLGVMLVNRSG